MFDGDAFPNAQAPGTRIGPVVLERPLGQGAWGIVYEGRHDVYGHVAVKEYFPSSYGSRKSGSASVGSSAPQWQDAVRRGLERFAQEGKALRTIRHENVVAVVDFIEQDGTALLVMEYIEGRTLTAAMEAGEFRDPASITALGATLIDTLAAIHAKNILHRDIAPDNIMIRPDGSPVLIDFGGAAAAVATATRSTQNIVKDGYSPPEQYDTSSNPTFPVGPWSDIYATAAVLYRLATGKELPVSNARLLAAGTKSGADPLVPLRTLNPPGYSKEWLAAIDSGLALLPKDRPQSAAAWRKQFEPVTAQRNLSPVMLAVTGGSVLIAAVSAGAVLLPKVLHPGPTPSPQQPVAVVTAKPHAPVHNIIHRSQPNRHENKQQPAQPQQPPVYIVQGGGGQGPAPTPQVRVVYVTQPPRHEPAQQKGSHGNGSHSGNGQTNQNGTTNLVLNATAAPPTVPPPTPAPPTYPPPTAAPTVAPTLEPTVRPTFHIKFTPRPPIFVTPQPVYPTPPVKVFVTPVAFHTIFIIRHPPWVIATAAHQVVAVVPGTCAMGYVWREAIPSDHVCVPPAERTQAAQQNALALSRKLPTSAYCVNGYVWREAYAGDVVCVTPPERSLAREQNALAASRVAH